MSNPRQNSLQKQDGLPACGLASSPILAAQQSTLSHQLLGKREINHLR
jgi:hypothetical protein